jgi:uncharacterized protein
MPNINPTISSKRISMPAHILLGLQKLYKVTLSPLIGRQCRYLPSCSDYAADCVKKHGAWIGSWMGFARVCRCHPNGGSGYDPAPDAPNHGKWYRPWEYGDWDNRVRLPSCSEAVGQIKKPSSSEAVGQIYKE